MTRILNVIRHPVGGIRSYLRYTYSALPAGDWSTTVLTIDVEEAHLIRAGLAPPSRLEFVADRDATLRLGLASLQALQSREYQLVHSQGATAGIVTAPGARLLGVPHVVTFHETFRVEQFAGVTGAMTRRALAATIGLADGIVVLGRDAQSNLFECVPLDASQRDKVHVVPNGVPVAWLTGDGSRQRPGLRARLGVPSDVALFGFVGRFMPEKGFDLLVHAVSELRRRGDSVPPFRVVAVNDGAYMREYLQTIESLGLTSHFAFVELQPSAAGTLCELDAVIMPSRREACPLVAMEALVLACPLIATNCVGLREVTAGTPALVAESGDAVSVADAMQRVLADRPGVAAAARAFAPRARERFDASRTAASMATLFRQVMARSAR